MNRNLTLLALSLMTWGIGEGMFIFFQPLYLQQLGANPVMIGSILGLTGVAMTLAHLPAGYLSDRIGRRPVLWAAWSIATLAAWVMALADSLPLFVVGAVFYGMTAFVSGPMNGYITAARGRWTVARALTLISATYNTGAILGPLLGGWVGQNLGLRWCFGIAAVFFLVSTVIVLFIQAQPVEIALPEGKNARWAGLINARYATFMVVVFVSLYFMYLPQPLSQNFLQNERGLSLGNIGSVISLRSAGVVFLNLTLGHFNARYSFLLAQAFMGGFAFLIWKGSGMPWYLVGYFLMGSFQTARSLAVAQARALVKASNMGLAYGMLETIGGLVIIFGPPLAGALYSLNPTWPYLAGILGCGIGLLISAFFIPLRPDEIH